MNLCLSDWTLAWVGFSPSLIALQPAKNKQSLQHILAVTNSETKLSLQPPLFVADEMRRLECVMRTDVTYNEGSVARQGITLC